MLIKRLLGHLTRTSTPNNKELVTVIECISTLGDALHPTIVLKGKVITTDFCVELPPDWNIGVSTTGWTNDNIGQYWLEDFNKQTKPRLKGK